MAAGVTLQPANLDPFRARLNDLARRTLKPDQLQPPLRLDAEVRLDEMTVDSLTALDQLQPTGQGNPPVQFFARNLTQQRALQRIGAQKQHLKLWVTDGHTTHEALWWGAANECLSASPFDLAFAPQINDYHGRRTVQLKVLDWRPP
jgi:single-stranded-DNA-specific exonuclease